MCSARRIGHTSKVRVSATLLLQSVWNYSLRCCGALQCHHNVRTRFVTTGHKVKCKFCKLQVLSFYCKIAEIAKYGNIAHENVEVNLEAVRNSHIGLRTVSHISNLRKDT